MIYVYTCPTCKKNIDVVKGVAEIDREELCECGAVLERLISRTFFYGADDWHGDEYHPGLGCVVKSRKHANQIARARGLEELGTEPLDKIHSAEENSKALKEKAWQEEAKKAASEQWI
jgi:hypothetical protein